MLDDPAAVAGLNLKQSGLADSQPSDLAPLAPSHAP